MILGAYRLLTTAGGPLIGLYLARRRKRGKEDAARFTERLGIASQPRPGGKLAWLHAASVGESLSLLSLIDAVRARYPDWSLLVTTGTVTSAALMGERLPTGVIHQYVPVDRTAYVRRFLDHWRPDLALWAESEFWPNLVTRTAARGVPMVLVNGRVSARSFRSWQRFGGLIRRILSGFALCLGQTEEDADRLRALGARHAVCHGNLKYAAAPLPAPQDALDALKKAIGNRPVWLAASTHAGEEAIAGRVHQALAAAHPGLLTVIVPRHPQRGGDIAADLTRRGLAVARRADQAPLTAETDIYLADTLGELGLFYRACPLVFIGKTLSGQGGQNPIEPAQLGCALVFGPHMENFTVVADHLLTAKGAIAVTDETGLAEAIGRLLSDDGERARLGANAKAVADREAGALDGVLTALAPFFEKTEAPHAPA